MLSCVLPNSQGASDVHIKAPRHSKLWNFDALIYERQQFYWDAPLFISQQEHDIVGEHIVVQEH